MVTIAEDNRRKHLTILKNLYSGDKTLIDMAGRAQAQFDGGEGDKFWAFQVDVGNLFIELKEELDEGLENLADLHPEEPDPRKWDEVDWFQFHTTTVGHPFYEIYATMAKGEPNIDLIWAEIEARIDFS